MSEGKILGGSSPWEMYDRLIAGIPEDVQVVDYCLGTHWTYVEAECGMGVAWTCSGGASRKETGDLRGRRLADVAKLSKSWCFEEATLGVAALNAWYSRPELLDPMGVKYDEPVEMPDGSIRKMDAFELYRPYSTGRNVVVVGHFPHVERIAEYAKSVTVLERKCSSSMDTPDPACEYVMPEADIAFITGVTIINKTAPRLLQLAENAKVIMTGPSVVMAPQMFEYGIENLAGSAVADPEAARFAVQNGVGKFFGKALQMCSLVNPQVK